MRLRGFGSGAHGHREGLGISLWVEEVHKDFLEVSLVTVDCSHTKHLTVRVDLNGILLGERKKRTVSVGVRISPKPNPY